MRTRARLSEMPLFGGKRCVYCPAPATTNDHAPPRCLLRRPLPSNLLTLPACAKCNTGFSFDKNVVRALLALVSTHPDLVAERGPQGRLTRALERDHKLRAVLARSRRLDGDYGLTDELLSSLHLVFCKSVQGLFYGLHERLVEPAGLKLLRIENSRLISAETVAEQLRPSPLMDITDEPLSEITRNSWHSREPVLILKLQPVTGGPPVNRVLRLKRDTPIEWIEFQPGIFRFAFVKQDGADAACVFELWETLIVAIATPWPDSRGPLRRGRSNPLSRERRADPAQ